MSIYKNNQLDTLEVTAKRIKKPIIVNDANDPRLKSYNDSLNIYNNSKIDYNKRIQADYKDDFNSWKQLVRENVTTKVATNTELNSMKPALKNYYKYGENSESINVKKIYKNKDWTGEPTADLLIDGYIQHASRYAPGFNQLNNKIKPISARYNSDGIQALFYKKPVQPIVYQKPIQQPVQQVVQPTVQTIQQAPQSKENWEAKPNTIIFNMNGKEMFSTSDKVNELFKTDIDKMTAAGVSQRTIDSILKQKYKIRNRETTYLPDDATQKAITVRSTNLYK